MHRVSKNREKFARPYRFAKSISFRRFDVSRNSRRAKRDAKVSQNDIEMSHVDMEKARPVDFWSHSVAKSLVLTASRRSMAFAITRDKNVGYGKTARNKSEVRDQKVSF